MLTKRADVRASEVTPKDMYLRRREFMAMFGTVVATSMNICRAAPVQAAQQRHRLAIGSKMVTTNEALTAHDVVSGYNNFYEFGEDKDDPVRYSDAFNPLPWTVEVTGECAKPGRYTLDDILRPHPLEERIYRMRCVEGWSMVIPWVGFSLRDLLRRFEPNGNTRFVEFTTVLRPQEMVGQRQRFPPILPWPYKEGLRIDEAMHPLALMAVGLYGETLPNQNGAPLRLVVPWKYGFKGIKSIVKISFVRTQPTTTWQAEWPQAYGFYSNVNPAVDHPRFSQASERRIGEFRRRPTLIFNGYAEQVASMYTGMDLRKYY